MCSNAGDHVRTRSNASTRTLFCGRVYARRAIRLALPRIYNSVNVKWRSHRGRSAARNGRYVSSTAVDRDRSCSNAGGGLKNLTLTACYGRRWRTQCHILTPSLAFAHVRSRWTTVDGTLRPSTAVMRRKRPQWERYWTWFACVQFDDGAVDSLRWRYGQTPPRRRQRHLAAAGRTGGGTRWSRAGWSPCSYSASSASFSAPYTPTSTSRASTRAPPTGPCTAESTPNPHRLSTTPSRARPRTCFSSRSPEHVTRRRPMASRRQ